MEKFWQRLWYGKHKLTHSNFTWSSSYYELYALDLPRQANVGGSCPLKKPLRVYRPLAWVWAAGLPRWIRIAIYQLSMANWPGKAQRPSPGKVAGTKRRCWASMRWAPLSRVFIFYMFINWVISINWNEIYVYVAKITSWFVNGFISRYKDNNMYRLEIEEMMKRKFDFIKTYLVNV